MENAKNAGSACFFVRFALISQPVSRLKGRLFVFINPPKFFAMKKLILIFLTVWSFSISFAAAAPSPKEEKENSARWITAAEGDVNARGAWIAFRKDVTLKRVPRSVELTIGADSKYWLWVNGELVVFEGSLKRGPRTGCGYYDVVDVAPYLHKGDNKVAFWPFGFLARGQWPLWTLRRFVCR